MPPATSDQALGNLNAFQSSMQSPQATLQGAEQSLGVPQQQQQVSGLRQAIANTTNLLNNVTPSVEGRTQNSLVTDAQANRQIQNESAPIAKTLSDQTGKEATAESDLNSLLSQANNQANLTVQGNAQKLSALKDIYDALYGKEADQAKLTEQQKEFAASQGLDQQKLQEQIREANATNSLDQQKLQASQAPSPAQVKQADMSGAAQYLNSLKGGDGHVSQQTWNNAMQQWVNAGYSTGEFVKQFMPFVNQRYSGYHGFS